VRSGIQSVPKGQTEGALSLGFSRWEAMVRIIIPQAIKNILPVIGNEFVTLIKESSQVSVIGMADLMYTATTIQGISFQPFPPLVIVAVYYFILTFVVSNILRALEWKFKIKAVR
jgi:arginine/lysine/histidine transport system permease protein